MEANSVYKNYPLAPSTRSIRLLELVDTGAEAIECQFVVKTLDACPPYFALSYTWGPKDDGFKIDIGGHEFIVRENLKNFFVQTCDRREWYDAVVSPEREHLLWIDAICIDQKNAKERNRQVELMGEIYQQATFVCVWLGAKSSNSDRAMDCLSRLNPRLENSAFIDILQQSLPSHMSHLFRQTIDVHAETSNFSGPWSTTDVEAIKALCERPYWCRVWIIQELILAKRIILLCGTKSVRFKVLNDLLSKITTDEGQPAVGYQDLYDSTALRILESKLWWKKASKKDYPGLPLPNLLIAFAYADASDMRDKVYGLRSLAEERWKVAIDYEKSLLDVYKDVLTSMRLVGEVTFIRSNVDRAAFCRRLQESLGLSHTDIAVRLVTSSFAPIPFDSKATPTWYRRLRDSKNDIKFASLLQNADDLSDDTTVQTREMKIAQEYWNPLAAMSRGA